MKWHLFRHLSGGRVNNRGATISLYRWMINERVGGRWRLDLPSDRWKKDDRDYLRAAQDLFGSMSSHGWVGEPIPVDGSHVFLNGSHRIACALAIGMEMVPTLFHPKHEAWAPAWNDMWFIKQGCEPILVQRLEEDLVKLGRGETPAPLGFD